MGELVLNVNGKPYSVNAPAEESLLSVLRNHLNLTGTKYGCGEGQCGACTVLMVARRAFLPIPAAAAAGTNRSSPSKASNRTASSPRPAGLSGRRGISMRVLHHGNDHEQLGSHRDQAAPADD